MISRRVWVSFVVLASCSGPAEPASTEGTPRERAVEDVDIEGVREGVLVAYQNGGELGRESYRDDGGSLRSELVWAGAEVTLTITRDPAALRVEQGEISRTRELPEGTVALPNGQWQAYTIAAERYADAREPQPIEVVLGASAPPVPGTIEVQPGSQGARRVIVTLGPTIVNVEIDAAGQVVRAEIPTQRIEVVREGTAPRALERRPPPAGIAEEPLEVERDGVALRGVIWRPEGAREPLPVAVIIAGSGPTDRDGNQRPLLDNDMYRLLAGGLAQAGIASIRYDKRGVGESGRNFDASRVVLDDFVEDAAAIVRHARARFSRVTLVGHSEGGLIALEVAEPLDALVLLATAGRPVAELLAEQLNRSGSEEAARIVAAFLDAVRHERPVPDDARAILQVFPPPVHPFLRSELDIDPVALLRARRTPATVIQGTTDIQVRPRDAALLGAARRDVRVVLLERANHLFKEEADAAPDQASYTDPGRPLVDGFVRAVATAVAR